MLHLEKAPLPIGEALAALNESRLSPAMPRGDWRRELETRHELELREVEWLESWRREAAPRAADAPTDPDEFVAWFEELEESGPGQGDPLFDWLAHEADFEQMRWFVAQEVGGEAGFEDLVALSQLKLPARPKLEMARNYWDEMGRGIEKGMHGPMLAHVARELRIEPGQPVVAAAAELSHVMAGLAHHRRYAYHSIGALGAIELTAPGRAAKVYRGLKRLGVAPVGTQYYLIHSTLDVKHSLAWNEEVLKPLVAARPGSARALAEGALMRLRAGERCFEAYRGRFGIAAPPR